ncbi:MAG: Universal stress protein family [Frankiaceae bacterium]|jgi:nucleotide-binding universal stress UspA family protein|nr:Universal stress protein family [Frankiaceae bacterium]
MTAPIHPFQDIATCYAQVLVPVDFSSLSWNAVSVATALARGWRVPYRVVHVDTSAPWLDRPTGKVTLHTAPDGQCIEIDVVTAPSAAKGIAAFLGDDESSLLVMASRGHRAIAELALGSTAEELLRSWRGPIVLIGPQYQAARPAVTRLVVAVPPLEQVSPELAADVRGWAARFGVPVQVVTVLDSELAGYDFDQRHEHLHHLTELAESMGAVAVPLSGSRPAHELVTYANAQPGSVLVMAPRVRSVAAQLLLGSFSKAVLRHATNPVLLRHA